MREIMPSALAPNSGYFIASGASHCTIPGNSLYSVEAEGVRLIDWLAALVDDGSWERTVDCCGDARSPTSTARPAAQQQPSSARGAGGKAQWECAAAFAQHYRAAGFAAPNSTDAGRVQRLYRDFERRQCTNHIDM